MQPQYQQDVSQPLAFDGAAGDRRSGGGWVSGADVLGEPVSRTQEYPAARPRVSSAPQPEPQSRAQQPSSGTRRSQQSQGAPRQASAPQSTAGAASAEAGQRTGTSSFPHAFERWETLSSHWEGLTSYWLHKLEQNTEEIRTAIPNASTLNRQITDLSAAGANLFHAVVELQRLRASSERKFQRWFFETRADTERSSETQAQMERQLRLERSAREEAANRRAEAEEAATYNKRELVEMRRELMISKEEARRAWEELGRKSDEEQVRAENLKAGRMITISGVSVVPYYGGPSRSGTGGSQRPMTSEGQYPVQQHQQYQQVPQPPGSGAAGGETPGDEQEYYREEPSPTNTDPFTEQSQQAQQPPLHHEADRSSFTGGTYRPGGNASIAAGAASHPTAMPESSQRAHGSGQAGSYQYGGTETFLQSPQSSSHGAARQAPPAPREDLQSEASYVDTISEGDTEYAIDGAGNIRYDDQGRPIVFRRPQRRRGPRSQISEDDYGDEALPHERERDDPGSYGAGYSETPGGSAHGLGTEVLPEAPSVPSTSAQAMASYQPTSGGGASGGGGGGGGAQGLQPQYGGEGYGSWDALQTRHHHPTRLSDVLEEEEDRSSRRTGE